MANQFSKYPLPLQFYRDFRTLMAGFLALYFSYQFYLNAGSIPLAMFMVLFLPVAAPFMYRALFGQEEPHYLLFYLGTLLVFLFMWPFAVWPFFVFVAASGLVAFLLSDVRIKRTDTSQNVPPRHVSPDVPKTTEDILKANMEEALVSIQRLQRKYQLVDDQAKRTQEYLSNVEMDLRHPLITEANRTTTEHLRDSLQRLLSQQLLMRQFFARATQQYERHRHNLELKLRNQQVIDYLQSQRPSESLLATEKTLLDMEFKAEIERIEAELPNIEATQQAKSQLLSADLTDELKQAIDRLDER